MNIAEDTRQQLEKTRRIADMLCTAHAGMRDRLHRLATTIDLAILLLSVFLVAHTFTDVSDIGLLHWLGISYGNWLGALAAAVFALSLIQMRVNWKAKSEAHARSFSIYAEVKRDIARLLAKDAPDDQTVSRVLSRYDLAGDVGVPIPETEFLKQKQRHRIKTFVSDYLDTHPGAWIPLIHLKLFLKDTFGWDGFDSNTRANGD